MCTPAPHPDLKFLPHMRHRADSTDLSVLCFVFMCLRKFATVPIITSHKQQYTALPSGNKRLIYNVLICCVNITWIFDR